MTSNFGMRRGAWRAARPASYDQLVAKREVLGDEVGFLGEESPNDRPNDPKKEHRHLINPQESDRCWSII